MAGRQTRTSAKRQRQVTEQTDGSSVSEELLSPDELARALRAVAAELERNPALARRVADAMRVPAAADEPPGQADTPSREAPADAPNPPRQRPGKAFRPRLVTGTAPNLGPGVPDPFALRAELGEDGLRAVLADLRLGTLRAIVREHRLDPGGQLAGQNDDAKFRALILRATKRGQRG